jgi:hypothetical protein
VRHHGLSHDQHIYTRHQTHHRVSSLTFRHFPHITPSSNF